MVVVVGGWVVKRHFSVPLWAKVFGFGLGPIWTINLTSAGHYSIATLGNSTLLEILQVLTCKLGNKKWHDQIMYVGPTQPVPNLTYWILPLTVVGKVSGMCLWLWVVYRPRSMLLEKVAAKMDQIIQNDVRFFFLTQCRLGVVSEKKKK